MIANEKKSVAEPAGLVPAELRGKEANNPDYGRAEQARKIRVRRVS